MRFHWTLRRPRTMSAAVPAGLLAVTLAMLATPADAARVQSIDVAANRIVLRFDGAASGGSAFLLDGPQRLAVDLDGVDPAPTRPDLAPGGGGGAIRQLRRGPHATRVVFALAQPAVIDRGRFSIDGRALTIRLKGTDADGFTDGARAGRATFQLAVADRRSFDSPVATPAAPALIPVVDTPPADGSYADAVAADRGPAPRVRVAGRAGKPLVVIDPGHGGHDPGSMGIDGVHREKDAALAIARAVRDELLASGRVRVAMTRDDDRFVVLDDRREIARRLGADLFISIHADSAPGSDARGATIYTLSEVSSDKVAARLAAKENKADIINGVDLGHQTNDVSSILIDLAQRETMNVSANFANLLQRELSPMIAFKQTYHRFAGLVVLKAPDVPSVLFETGYMSSPEDLRLLFSPGYQHSIAIGVRNAVEAHFARRLHIETADAQ